MPAIASAVGDEYPGHDSRCYLMSNMIVDIRTQPCKQVSRLIRALNPKRLRLNLHHHAFFRPVVEELSVVIAQKDAAEGHQGPK